MKTAYHDSVVDDAERRRRLYDGEIFVFSPRASSLALVEHARDMIEEAFGDIDPRDGAVPHAGRALRRDLRAAEASRSSTTRTTKELLRTVLDDFGCDLEPTYLDVPRLRMVDERRLPHVRRRLRPPPAPRHVVLGADVAAQLVAPDLRHRVGAARWPSTRATASQAVKNGSNEFNYYEWNSTGRKDAAKHIKTDTRKQPKPEEPIELDPQIRIVPPAGGIVLFSARAAALDRAEHDAGRARYSIDFRTVHLDDVESRRWRAERRLGAARARRCATSCALATWADRRRRSSRQYDEADVSEGELVFRPS